MSESIHAGYLPLWNPYINYGIPQYADMNAGYWSPVTWLIASTVGYNPYTFTVEELCYLIAGGIGMYKLTDLWSMEKSVRIITGISFMCCGFNVGHLQHFNWISGAALLPWCFWAYHKILNEANPRNIILCALIFYLFIASAHPGLIIGSFYFFLSLLIFIYFKKYKKDAILPVTKKLFFLHIGLFAALLLFGAGIISGYTDVIPHFARGDKLGLAESLGNTTSISSWISLTFPFATVKNDLFFSTDISMRNCYIGITLFIFFIAACFSRKTNWQKFLLLTGLLFALLSTGGLFKTFTYHTLPMIGYVRLNGEFRIFALLCFILAAALELDKLIKQKHLDTSQIRKIIAGTGFLLIAFTCVGIYKVFQSGDSIVYNIFSVLDQPGIVNKIKALIDSITFYDTLWFQGFIQLIFLYLMWWCISRGKYTGLVTLTIINMVLSTLLNVPYTGTGKASLRDVHNVIEKAPAGFPAPTLRPIVLNDTLPDAENKIIGDWNIYNKQIGNKREYPYPIVLNNMRAYYTDTNQLLLNSHKAFIFVSPHKNPYTLRITNFSPGNMTIMANTAGPASLVLQQNYYPHWFYANGSESQRVVKAGVNFMSAPLQAGPNNVQFYFKPTIVIYMMLLSLLSISLAVIYLIYLKFR